ncbi:MAG: TonB-dependent receptor [Burkholderiaceae bacterium]|nr:TonB-dependent receptor [Burkholderiaceae bacterium]
MTRQFTLTTLSCALALAFAAVTPAHAQSNDTTTPAADDSRDKMDAVAVYGHRESRQVENVTRKEIAEAAPGTSPLKVLERMPGVEFQGADPWGNYEWAERITVRGFSQNYMGFTLDGIPLGDMSYGNSNGLHISRAISQENIGSVQMSQGSGALSTNSTSNLGGTVQFFSDAPEKTFTVKALQGVGSDSSARTFLRVDSGKLATGATAYVSYTDQVGQKWKGVGGQYQTMVDAKLVQPLSEGSLSFYGMHQERKEIDYQDFSKGMVSALGWNWDNYGSVKTYANALQGNYINPNVGLTTDGTDPGDAAYGGSSGLRKDDILATAIDLNLSHGFHYKNTLYYHHDLGQGHYVTTPPGDAPPAPAGSLMVGGTPVSVRTTDYGINREGTFGALTWKDEMQEVEAGYWVENNDHTLSRNYHALYNINQNNEDMDWLGMGDVYAQSFNQKFNTRTTQFYLEDTLHLMDDRLTVNFGFKSPNVRVNADVITNALSIPSKQRAGGTITASNGFLPEVGVNYELGHGQEVFASVAQNMRAFTPGVTGVFAQSQANFNAIGGDLKPETSTTIEAGYRFHDRMFQGVVDVYHTDFYNRLLQVSPCQTDAAGCPYTFHNVGNVQTDGIEAALDTRLTPVISWYNSISYNVSQYKDNYVDASSGLANGIVPTSGKDVVDAPRLMFTTDIGYEDGSYFAHFSEKFTDKRYYTYLNDQSVPSYWLANLDAGYKLERYQGVRDIRLSFSVTNLFNQHYFSTIGTNGFGVSGDNQTLQIGAPRAAFLTLSGKY